MPTIELFARRQEDITQLAKPKLKKEERQEEMEA
jgi:hypothetical protein